MPRGRQPRLSDEQVDDIRRRYEPGQNSRQRGNAAQLAEEFGVTTTYITILARGLKRPPDPMAEINRTDLQRLLNAGLSEEAAAKVMAHPLRGPAVIAPGIVISMFPLSSGIAQVVA